MRTLTSLGLLAVLLAPSLTAQVRGLPVVNNGVPTGIGLAVDAGFADRNGGKATTYGASAAIGLGFVGVGGAVSRTDPETGEAGWSQAVSASLNILGGPLVPVRVTMMGGVGRWESNGFTVTRIPVSLGLSATIPLPALAIKPWIAPRYERLKFENATGDDRWAVAGGIDFAMINGLSFRAAYDRTFLLGNDPGILSFGLGFAP
ncbi:MAG: hypothetical protein SFU84_03125 [Gemmatimonadales bacterium]|jgi:hypothetical protein|nr:hypothetical protein [Gemmatimonadales bacterium]